MNKRHSLFLYAQFLSPENKTVQELDTESVISVYSAMCQNVIRAKRRGLNRLGGEDFLEEVMPKPVRVSQKRKGKDKCKEFALHHIYTRQHHCSVLGEAVAVNSTADIILPMGPAYQMASSHLTSTVRVGLFKSPLPSFHD